MRVPPLVRRAVLLLLMALGLRCTLIGVCTSDGVILSGSKTLLMGSTVLSRDHECVRRLHPDSCLLLAVEGDPSDCDDLVCRIQQVNDRHRMQFGQDLPLVALAAFAGRYMHEQIRRSPLRCRLLLGGVDCRTCKPELYWIDETAAVQKVRYGAQGRDVAIVLSTLDQLDREQRLDAGAVARGLACVQSCWQGVERRTEKSIGNLITLCATSEGVAQS